LQLLKKFGYNLISWGAMRVSFLKAAIPPRRDFLRSPNAPLTLKTYLSTGGKEDRLYRGFLMGLSSDEF